MNGRDCTEIFVRYRELCRMTWNLGFWPNRELHAYDAVALYQEAVARLFEGMVLLSVGIQGRVQDVNHPGDIIPFNVIARRPAVQWLVAKAPPDSNDGRWESSEIPTDLNAYRFRFLGYFDWDEQAPRDCRYIKFLIMHFEPRRELVGRYGLIEATECSIVLDERSASQLE